MKKILYNAYILFWSMPYQAQSLEKMILARQSIARECPKALNSRQKPSENLSPKAKQEANKFFNLQHVI